MSTEANKAIVSRLWEEVWNQNNLSVCDEIFDFEPETLRNWPNYKDEFIAERRRRYTIPS